MNKLHIEGLAIAERYEYYDITSKNEHLNIKDTRSYVHISIFHTAAYSHVFYIATCMSSILKAWIMTMRVMVRC